MLSNPMAVWFFITMLSNQEKYCISLGAMSIRKIVATGTSTFGDVLAQKTLKKAGSIEIVIELNLKTRKFFNQGIWHVSQRVCLECVDTV